jgi:hypothetical protein
MVVGKLHGESLDAPSYTDRGSWRQVGVGEEFPGDVHVHTPRKGRGEAVTRAGTALLVLSGRQRAGASGDGRIFGQWAAPLPPATSQARPYSY